MSSIKEIDSEILKSWQMEGKLIRLIDVRSTTEINQGIIQDGEPLPLHLLPLKTTELDTGHDIIFYCRSGARSAQACYYMKQNGFHRVYNLRGGILDWLKSGNNIVSSA